MSTRETFRLKWVRCDEAWNGTAARKWHETPIARAEDQRESAGEVVSLRDFMDRGTVEYDMDGYWLEESLKFPDFCLG